MSLSSCNGRAGAQPDSWDDRKLQCHPGVFLLKEWQSLLGSSLPRGTGGSEETEGLREITYSPVTLFWKRKELAPNPGSLCWLQDEYHASQFLNPALVGIIKYLLHWKDFTTFLKYTSVSCFETDYVLFIVAFLPPRTVPHAVGACQVYVEWMNWWESRQKRKNGVLDPAGPQNNTWGMFLIKKKKCWYLSEIQI